jgi:hypothetical protein
MIVISAATFLGSTKMLSAVFTDIFQHLHYLVSCPISNLWRENVVHVALLFDVIGHIPEILWRPLVDD